MNKPTLGDLEGTYGVTKPLNGGLVLTATKGPADTIVAGASPGSRHNDLLKVMGVFRAQNVPTDIIVAACQEINQRTHMGLPDHEIISSVKSTEKWAVTEVAEPPTPYIPRTPTWADVAAMPKEVIVLRLNGERIGSPGNVTVLISSPGSGKSSTCQAVVANRINPTADCLGLTVHTD